MRPNPYFATTSEQKYRYVLTIMDIWPSMLHHVETLLWHISLMHNPHRSPWIFPLLENHK